MSPRDIGHDVVDCREAARAPVLVPATIIVNDRAYNVRVRNIVCGGVMLETIATLSVGDSLLLQSGTIEAKARVVWTNEGRIGARFERPIDRDQVAQQVVRSAALLGWQEEALQAARNTRIGL